MDDIIHIIGISSNEGQHASKDVTSNTPLQVLPPTCLHTHISIHKVCTYVCIYIRICVCVCVLALVHPFVYECVHELVCVSTLNIRTYDTVCYVYGYLCRVMYSDVLTCSHSIRVLAVPSCSAQCHV